MIKKQTSFKGRHRVLKTAHIVLQWKKECTVEMDDKNQLNMMFFWTIRDLCNLTTSRSKCFLMPFVLTWLLPSYFLRTRIPVGVWWRTMAPSYDWDEPQCNCGYYMVLLHTDHPGCTSSCQPWTTPLFVGRLTGSPQRFCIFCPWTFSLKIGLEPTSLKRALFWMFFSTRIGFVWVYPRVFAHQLAT